MPTSRVVPKRLPVSPGQDSRYTIRRNAQEDNQWWVYYKPQGADRIPADDPHLELVARVNRIKEADGKPPGGSFSINEHMQVIARMGAPAGHAGNAVHVVDVAEGGVYTYSTLITFRGGAFSPSATVTEGTSWPGPLCGTTYAFAAPNAPRPPSNCVDEVRIEVNGRLEQLSAHCGITPYPPSTGPLAAFLAALRRQLPGGGRFRVNEMGKAFCSNETLGNRFIGTIPLRHWFPPISPID